MSGCKSKRCRIRPTLQAMTVAGKLDETSHPSQIGTVLTDSVCNTAHQCSTSQQLLFDPISPGKIWLVLHLPGNCPYQAMPLRIVWPSGRRFSAPRVTLSLALSLAHLPSARPSVTPPLRLAGRPSSPLTRSSW